MLVDLKDIILAQADKFPRLFNLVMLLLDARRPISLEEIVNRIGGFPELPDARRQAFERAKKDLRDLGIPLSTHQIPGKDQYGYFIDRSEMVIPDLSLNDDEASALAAASAMVSFGSGERDSALSKLGCVISGQDATVANVPSQQGLYPLFEAIAVGKAVQFGYHSKMRTLDVYGISFRWGSWYLIGRERDSREVKTFRVNLIETEVMITDLEAEEKTAGFDHTSILPKNRWEIGNGAARRARVIFAPEVAPSVGYELREESVVERRGDGSLVADIDVVDNSAFFDWLLGFFDKANLVKPESLVQEFVEYLSELTDSGHLEELRRELKASTHGPHPQVADSDLESGTLANPKLSPAHVYKDEKANEAVLELRSASTMFSTLAKILPWLARKKTTTVDEIAQTFGLERSGVVRLLELAACCGLPPYTPDSLLEIIVDDDGTVLSYLDMEIITAPRRLTTLEVMVLATTASVALGVPGIDPEGHLKSGLKKLESSLSQFRLGLSDLDVDFEEPYFLSSLRAAANEHRSVDISYFSLSSERTSRRRVDPYVVFMESGRWYLRGFCHLTNEIRHFSLGRITSCVVVDEFFEVPEDEMKWFASGLLPKAYGGSGEMVVAAIGTGSRWLVEKLIASPNFLGRQNDFEVFSFTASSYNWLSITMLRLGPSALILSPEKFVGVKEKAAKELLKLYT